MTRKEIEKFVTKIASPIVNDHSIELVDVEFLKEGPEYYLRIYIDKPEGIKIDDCKFVSEKISDILDKEDPIPQRYFLEVSSPGLERPLKKDSDFEKYKGQIVEIKVFNPINGKKIFVGKLLGYDPNTIFIEDDNGESSGFERSGIALIKRQIQF